MARGAGPYLLAYGRGGAADARMDLTAMLREVSVQAAELGAPRTLGGAALLKEPRGGIRWRLTLLWLALVVGVALLAFMAYRLAAELRSPPDTSA